jgi:hypothetical protein
VYQKRSNYLALEEMVRTPRIVVLIVPRSARRKGQRLSVDGTPQVRGVSTIFMSTDQNWMYYSTVDKTGILYNDLGPFELALVKAKRLPHSQASARWKNEYQKKTRKRVEARHKDKSRDDYRVRSLAAKSGRKACPSS